MLGYGQLINSKMMGSAGCGANRIRLRIRGCWGSTSKRIAASAAPERGLFPGKSRRRRGGTDERGDLAQPAPLSTAVGCTSRTAWLRSTRGRTLTITMRWVRKRTSSMTPVQVMP